jgi:hypothetical protein
MYGSVVALYNPYVVYMVSMWHVWIGFGPVQPICGLYGSDEAMLDIIFGINCVV